MDKSNQEDCVTHSLGKEDDAIPWLKGVGLEIRELLYEINIMSILME